MIKFTRKITALLLVILLLMMSFSACMSNEVKLEAKTDDATDTAKDEEIISEENKQGIITVAEGMLGVDGNQALQYSGSLGYGYNLLTSAYYNPVDIKASYSVIDIDKLAAEGYVYINHLTNAIKAKKELTHTTREYSRRITTSARCTGKVGLTGSFKASFDMDYNSEIKSDQVLINVHSKLLTRRDFMYGVTESILADHLTASFVEDVTKLSPQQLFDRYGTHVLKDVFMGGRYELNYIYTNSSSKTDKDIMASAEASNSWVSGEISVKTSEAKMDMQENSDINILAYGGNVNVDPNSIDRAQQTYPVWADGVNNGEIAFVDSSEIVPIWDIVAAMKIDKANEISTNLSKYFDSESDKISSEFKDSVSVKSYIASVHIGTGSSEMAAKNVLRQEGILEGNIVNIDLNRNAGGDYIYLGYKTTTNSSDALTGLCADYLSNASSSNTTYKNANYTIIPKDLNKGSGGKYIYLYYTHEDGAGKPITGIQYQLNNTFQYKNADGYEVVRSKTGGDGMDFNKSVGGDYIYLWFTRK